MHPLGGLGGRLGHAVRRVEFEWSHMDSDGARNMGIISGGMRMKDWDIKTILLGYDGSEGAEQAARLASALARHNSAGVVVVTAFPVHFDPNPKGEKAGEKSVEAHDMAQELVLKLRAAGIEAEPDALEGHASEALLRAAETHDADLIVVGRRGHGLTAGLLLGSTSEDVVRQAKVPVLVAH